MSFLDSKAYTVATGSATVNDEIILQSRAPAASDWQYKIGSTWVDQVGLASYILVSVTSFNGINTATWVSSAGGTTEISTLTGNSGGAISPTAGNINILGAGTLTFAGSGSTLTGTITPGTGLISTLTGGSGGALSPTAGNFNLLGTASQITSTGSGSTITFSLPSSITAPGSLTTTTSLTATLGAITATNGNLVFGTSGNKIISTSVASSTTAGANSFGKVTLVSGTATISTTSVTASSIIILTRQSPGATGAAALGQLSVGTISAATSFVINALTTADSTAVATTDVSSIAWVIIN